MPASGAGAKGREPMRMWLCGDVMLGRGIDQILPHPGDPTLREAYVDDARDYVTLAERVNGPIDTPVPFDWPWGDALSVLRDYRADVGVVNLETSITRSDRFAAGKAVHYRMNPANLPCLTAAGPDVCVLANNHVLDFGREGLAETLAALSRGGLTSVGAGRDIVAAQQPAVVGSVGGARLVVSAVGSTSSGVPLDWAATPGWAGVDLIPSESDAVAEALADRVQRMKQPGDVLIVSVHWGPNWGYEVSAGEVRVAHRLIDAGADVVFGHSSHHPRPIEVYRRKLILYGCGDFIDDYEGITGYEKFRDDLKLLYLVSVESGTGYLEELRLVPMQARRMRLHHASDDDSEWMRANLDQIGREFRTRVDRAGDGLLLRRLT